MNRPIRSECVDWFQLAENRVQWPLLWTVMKLGVQIKGGVTNWTTTTFSRKTLFHSWFDRIRLEAWCFSSDRFERGRMLDVRLDSLSLWCRSHPILFDKCKLSYPYLRRSSLLFAAVRREARPEPCFVFSLNCMTITTNKEKWGRPTHVLFLLREDIVSLGSLKIGK